MNIMLGVTDRCTGGCAYCNLPQRAAPEMSLPEVLTVLVEAADMGCQRLGIWGGEPLMRSDLGDIVAHAKDLGLFVTIDTNGHLLPERDDVLALADHINVSLDGDREAHDRARGEGTFDRTMRGIRHASGKVPLWTITVLTRHNLDQVDWLLDTATENGFLTTFQVLHHNETIGSNDGLRPDDDRLRQTVSRLLELKRAGAPIASSTRFLRYLRDWPDFEQTRCARLDGAPPCLAGDLYCNVDVDGSLYPCSLFIDEIEAPNVRHTGFAEAFETLDRHGCGSCAATCFSEYNLLFGLDWSTGWNWVRALR
jgi:MoaA/NifB/PqqE/SkfB family radical SAM enzyme